MVLLEKDGPRCIILELGTRKDGVKASTGHTLKASIAERAAAAAALGAFLLVDEDELLDMSWVAMRRVTILVSMLCRVL